MRPLVSVVIPTYNRESTLLRAINSVLEQTYDNLEVIVIDDGSTDNTKELVEGITDPRVFYYANEENTGCAAAKYRGVQLTKGEFIAFQDSDDEWLVNKLERQMEPLLADESLGMVYCKVRKIFKDGMTQEWPDEQIPREELSGNIYQRLLLTPLCSTQTTVFRKKYLEEVGGLCKELKSYEDYELSIRLAHRYPIGFVDEVLALMNDTEGSVNKRLADILMTQCKIMEDNAEELLESNLAMIKLKFELQEIALWGGELEEKSLQIFVTYMQDIYLKWKEKNPQKAFLSYIWAQIAQDQLLKFSTDEEDVLLSKQRSQCRLDELEQIYAEIKNENNINANLNEIKLVVGEMLVIAYRKEVLLDLKEIFKDTKNCYV